ncbi:MAG: tetratricopeptide repeat protein [Candidatus Auribacterota bacterium]
MLDKHKHLVWILPLFVITIVWGGLIKAPFLWDDHGVIVNNPFVGSLCSLRFLFSPDYFKAFPEASYRPVVTLSHIIDSALIGKIPPWHHFMNILLHTYAVLLAGLILCQFTASRAVVLAGMLLMAVHPIHTETIGVVSYRDDILMSIFMLAAVRFYMMFHVEHSLRAYLAVLMFAMLALFSKETALVLPLLMIAYDRIKKVHLRSVCVMYAGLAIVLAFYITVRFVLFRNPDTPAVGDYFISGVPMMIRPFYSFFLAVCSVFAPLVCFDYGELLFYVCAGTGVLLFFIVLWCIRRQWKRSEVLFGLIWFAVTLIPVMNIVPLENVFAGRYMYLPLIGAVIAVSGILQSASGKQQKKAYCIVAVIAVLFSAASLRYSRCILSEESFAENMAQSNPRSYKAYNYLATLAIDDNRFDDAKRFVAKALEIKPSFFEAVYNKGALAVHDNDYPAAEQAANRLIELNPSRSEGYRLWGDIQYDKDNLPLALTFYNQALERNSFDLDASINLGVAYEASGDRDRAAQLYRGVLAIQPANDAAWANLGNISIKNGDYPFAVKCYQQSLSVRASNAVTWYNLGNAYYYQKKWAEAERAYTTAMRLDPQFTDALHNLIVIYADTQQLVKETEALERYLKLKPGDMAAQYRYLFLKRQ